MKKSLYLNFIEFIKKHKLIASKQKVLIAVSGGVDSVVLTHLFQRAGFEFAIAHCNFKLRDKDADEDEKFVHELSKELNVRFYSHSFETRKYAEERKISIQMAARELRYNWFRQVMKENGNDLLATAHHANDQAETIILNMVKGSPVNSGIPVKNDNIIRPLLFASKEEIEDYAKEYNIQYRLDQSNLSDKYQRNLIRNKVIPLLETINPALVQTATHTAEIAAETTKWIEGHSKSIWQKIHLRKGNTIVISKDKWIESVDNYIIAWYLLFPFGFTSAQAKNFQENIGSTLSRVFYSDTHTLHCESSLISIRPTKTAETIDIQIEENQSELSLPDFTLKFEVFAKDQIEINSGLNVALLDYYKLTFPLTLRNWQKGDRFIPFGMKSSKLVSDFLTDKKIPASEKQKQLVLISNNDIVWLLSHRINDKYRIRENTSKVYKISLLRPITNY